MVHLVAASTVNYRYRLFFQVKNFELSWQACHTGCRKYRLFSREIGHFWAAPKIFRGHTSFDLCGALNLTPVPRGWSTEIFLVKLTSLGPGRTRANFVYFQFLARKKLAKISQGPNFGGGRIGPTCLSQNFADSHICHVTISTVKKTSRALIVQEWIVIYRWLFSRLSGFCWIFCFSLNRTTQHF